MNIWWIPTLLTIAMIAIVLRPYRETGMFPIPPFERVLWIVPISLTWTIFFAYLWLTKN